MWRALMLLLALPARAQNRVVGVSSACDRGSLTVALEMEQPFKGLLFSKDFSRECRVQGNHKTKVSLHLPTNACGVRSSTLNTTTDPDEELYYTVELVLQMDRQLQQSTDQELVVRCKLQPRAVRINSSALEGVINTKLGEMIGQEVRKTRVPAMWRALMLLLALPARAQNRVVGVSSACDRGSLTVALEMEQPFKGLLFSKDFSRECRVQGNHKTKVSLHLPTNACGVRSSTLNTTTDPDEELYYTVELVLQMDRQLQQSTDQELVVRCKLQPRAVRINSSALEGVINTKLGEMIGQEVRKTRTGRSRQGFAHAAEQRARLLEAARAWMELVPAAPAAEPARVEVGQPTRLLIQCTLPVGVGLRITNCVAHDGLGEASQKLLDEAGCPIDESIFTSPSIHQHKKGTEIDFADLEPVDLQRNIDENINIKAAKSDPELMFKNIMTYQHAVTTFAAFKFPDRAKLHLTCGIELCKGICPVVDCKALQRPQQIRDGLLRKARLDKDAKGVVIDRLEVYNSIEVLAPNIELEDEASIRGSRRIESEEDEFIRGFSPGDKTICLSPGKMALAFCVLGVIFLCAIAVAFISLVRARRRREPLHTSLSFYTGSKSMFSSSESSSSGLSGSKLLLTDSPYLDHHSNSSNNWPYSRAF